MEAEQDTQTVFSNICLLRDASTVSSHFHSAIIVCAATCRSVGPTGIWIAGTVNSLVLMAAGSTQVKFRGREATVLAEEKVWLRPPHLDHDLQTHEKGAGPVMKCVPLHESYT